MARVGVDDGNCIALTLSHGLLDLEVASVCVMHRGEMWLRAGRHSEGRRRLDLVLQRRRIGR